MSDRKLHEQGDGAYNSARNPLLSTMFQCFLSDCNREYLILPTQPGTLLIVCFFFKLPSELLRAKPKADKSDMLFVLNGETYSVQNSSTGSEAKTWHSAWCVHWFLCLAPNEARQSYEVHSLKPIPEKKPSKQVTWCFTPSQLLRLYQGERRSLHDLHTASHTSQFMLRENSEQKWHWMKWKGIDAERRINPSKRSTQGYIKSKTKQNKQKRALLVCIRRDLNGS